MKLACVVHRYGADIAGGSEAHCRQLAERLAARQHEVTVLTSCARDYVTWHNAYPAGESHVNGVRLLRFPVRRPRRLKRFADLSDEVFDSHAPPSRQEAWFEENGPDVPALLDHLRTRGGDYDLVIFWSYRYAPAYFGLPIVADRSVLVPTAEEDPAIALDVLGPYFRRPAGFLFLTPEEQWLVARRAGGPVEPSAIIGAGLDEAPPPPPGPLPVPSPYLLYLGRVDRNKGCATLFEYFLATADENRNRPPATLVLAGPARMPVPDHPRIRSLGFVDDALRDRLLAHATALVVPSPYESLSLALLEGWNHGVPAIVNAECRVLEGQVRRANGGLAYRSAREFRAALDWLSAHPAEARTLGAQGRLYVDREYRWPVVMARVEALLARVRAGR